MISTGKLVLVAASSEPTRTRASETRITLRWPNRSENRPIRGVAAAEARKDEVRTQVTVAALTWCWVAISPSTGKASEEANPARRTTGAMTRVAPR